MAETREIDVRYAAYDRVHPECPMCHGPVKRPGRYPYEPFSSAGFCSRKCWLARARQENDFSLEG